MKYFSFTIKVLTKFRRKKMEIVFGGIAFVVLFAGWVIVPTVLKKRHAVKVDNEENNN